MTVLTDLTAPGVVPVVVIDDAGHAEPLARALLAGGLPVAEITLRTPAALSALAAVAAVRGVLAGAGTVLTAEQVDAAVDAGAAFVVSPGLSETVARRCQERGVLLLPGTVTATEVQRAAELGFGTVKFFPAGSSGGVAAIRDLSAPFAGMRFVPTGGVSPANLADYLSLPSVPAVGGSWMAPRDLIAAGDFAEIEKRAGEAVRQAAEIRAGAAARG